MWQLTVTRERGAIFRATCMFPTLRSARGAEGEAREGAVVQVQRPRQEARGLRLEEDTERRRLMRPNATRAARVRCVFYRSGVSAARPSQGDAASGSPSKRPPETRHRSPRRTGAALPLPEPTAPRKAAPGPAKAALGPRGVRVPAMERAHVGALDARTAVRSRMRTDTRVVSRHLPCVDALSPRLFQHRTPACTDYPDFGIIAMMFLADS